MKERLLADLDARITRHADGDSTGVLDDEVLGVVTELTTTGAPDAGSLVRVAALHLCRYQALPPERRADDLRLATTLYTVLHGVDPRLVPPDVRRFLGLPSPHDSGVALVAEHERTGRLDQLDRAISLFRQEALEEHPNRADTLHHLGVALLRRYDLTGQYTDLTEAVTSGRAALTRTPATAPDRAAREAWLASALRRVADSGQP